MTKHTNAHIANNPKYKDQRFIDKYVMLWAYGYQNGLGAAEGLYRTINELGFSSLESDGSWRILDVGCGVGRTAADYASFFTNAEVLGIDTAPQMLDRAMSINLNLQHEVLHVDMQQFGFESMPLQTRNLLNLKFAEHTLDAYGLTKPHPYDLITAVNLLDRLASVPASLQTLFDLLVPRGTLICCTPLNFAATSEWEAYGSSEKIIALIQSVGFTVEIQFDGLPYREILDSRGA